MITSLLYTVLSTVLSIAMAFANAGALAETPGVPSWDAQGYAASAAKRGLFSPPPYGLTFDERLTEAFEDMYEETGFDFIGIADSIPDIFYYQRWITKLFPGVFKSLRENNSGDYIWGLVGMPKQLHFKTVPTGGGPDEYHMVIQMTFADGSTADYNTGNKYNAETRDLGYHSGLFTLGFNFNFREMYAYTAENPPMDAFGYTKLYDDLLLQNKAVNAITVRLKFPYQGKDWMLQIWKGRYFNTSGGEIGLYNKPPGRFIEFYDAATEDRIGMSFEVYVKETGQPLVVRPVHTHWWMTGFAINRYVYTPERLTLKTEIVPKDAEMLQGLLAALEREAAGVGMLYEVSPGGISILIEW